MTRQTAQPLSEYRTEVVAGVASEIAGSLREYLVLDPPYQRGAVWTEDQRMALVKSWLLGLPIPAVILNDRARNTWTDKAPDARHMAVVDGKQRIETALAWFSGDLYVPASWWPEDAVEMLTATEDGPYVNHFGLTRKVRTFARFQWKLPRIETRLATVREEAEMYLLVNGGGTAQTETDMANAAEVAKR